MNQGKKEPKEQIQSVRTNEWDRHDSTDLIEERSENWLNDDRFLDYEEEDESVFGRGDDYFERSQEESDREEDLTIEDYTEEIGE